MKLINPFDRQKKRDFIPLSLFPANKMTRTSMQLGRFVPLYCIELMQNNRIKVNANQLTRFATMSAPVMQNFSVELGAYFVPYVALDKFFDSSWMRSHVLNQSDYSDVILHAREFFNPSTPDVDRVAPGGFFVNQINSVSWVGSIFDHLQMADYTEIPDSEFAISDDDGHSFDDLLLSDSCLFSAHNVEVRYVIQYRLELDGVETFIPILPFDVWMFAIYGRSPHGSASVADLEEMMIASTDSSAFDISLATTFGPQWKEPVLSYFDLYDHSYLSFFGSTKKSSIIEQYFSYVQWAIARTKFSGRPICSNCAAWLAYLSIYGHYCLNELYCSHDDFNDLVGAGYIHSRSNDLDSSFGSYVDTLFADRPWLKFYADYIRKGECLPVLWNKDPFTAAQREEAASSVAVGETISENFFNRMYARFKDLIARMGSDYNRNAGALYGSRIPDNTLNYPQVVGHASFDVQVGDIAQTSEDGSVSNLGDFAGYAVSRDGTKSFDWTAEENGLFMVCAWVRPKFVSVSSAVPRMHFKVNYFDYLLPQFGGVGYQDISLKELYPKASDPDAKFAIQERYFEYMEVLNECSGLMRTSKQNYHLDRILDNQPQPLVAADRGIEFLYMTEKDNLNRIFNDQVSDPVSIACFFEGTVTRQLPATIQTEF